MMNPDFIKKDFCPYCGHSVDSGFNLDGESRPRPGDYTVCITCIKVSMFDNEMNQIKCNEKDIKGKALQEINKVRYILRLYHKEKTLNG